MSEPIIHVEKLVKEFSFNLKNKGFFGNLFKPEKKTIRAVDDVSFSVNKGEILAFIGPNGAGKSTTIKILTGILHPTSGMATVAGYNPQGHRRGLAFKIGAVFGQRSQLMFNLPPTDSFKLFGRIYELSDAEIIARQAELVELFDLQEFLNQPVRKLSLGQRMRAEVALSLMHKPEIVFLDEPTIGLDIVAKRKLRETLLKLNQEKGTTIFLTSHDVGDIEAICQRTIIVNNGKIIVDMPTDEMKNKYLKEKFISLEFKNKTQRFDVPGASVISFDGETAKLKVDVAQRPLNDVIKEILNSYQLNDIDVQDAHLEDIISTIYEG